MFEELNIDFSQDEIIKAISQLKTNKSGGPDQLINEFLIHGKHTFTPTLCVTRWTKQAFSCSKFLSPGGQLWANTAFEGSQFYSIGVPKFYSWVNVISVYVYNDLG